MKLNQFFYYFTGVDPSLICVCTEDDRRRYFTLGLELSILCLLNFVFVSYAISLILSSGLQTTILESIWISIFSISLAGCWTFVVLNFYRLVISSTGVGDGSSQISTIEFLSMIPKLIIAIMIAITTAVPMSVWILRSEINDISKLNSTTESAALYKSSISEEYEQKLIPLYVEKLILAQNLEKTVGDESVSVKNRMHQLDNNIDLLRSEEFNKFNEFQKNFRSSATLVNSAVRVIDLHGVFFTIVILFMILIHIIPLFLRANWVKGAYEYLVAFQEDIVLKKYGISKSHVKFYDKHIPKYAIPEMILNSEKSKHQRTRALLIEKLRDWTAQNNK